MHLAGITDGSRLRLLLLLVAGAKNAQVPVEQNTPGMAVDTNATTEASAAGLLP